MDSKIMNVLGDRVLELGPHVGESGPNRNFKLTHDGDGIATECIGGGQGGAMLIEAI